MIKKSDTKPRRRAEDIDRHVGARVRGRRIMLGLTQRQVGEFIGVTLQQACKYESGANRLYSGHLYRIARGLGVEVGFFFEGIGGNDAFRQQQRLLLKLMQYFIAIPSRRHQEELVSLVRLLAEPNTQPVAVRGSRRRAV